MVRLSHFLGSAIALAGTLHGVFASPISQSEDPLEKRQGSFFAITGVTTGGTSQRLEIRTLANSGLQWQLYLQALEKFQKAKQSGEASWYGVTGIHGNPVQSWDGVNGNGGGGGYCPHSSNLFGPWHRPFLALFEQRVHYYALQVANQYPAGSQRDAAVSAANTLRVPYWDWALAATPNLPAFVRSQQISVTRPNGQQQTIRNPLYSYKFHPLSPSDMGNFAPFSVYLETKREPTGTSANSPSNDNAVEAALENSAPGYKSRIYNLFNDGQSYNLVTNHGSGSQGDTFESVHDNIHGIFGSNSHMLYLSYSAFDPAFFLHHANVDRLLAMWQVLYPSTYVTPYQQSGATYTIQAGSTQGPDSPLTPFHKDVQGDFWTPNLCRDLTVFHYTYPELADNPSQATLRSRINSLYGGGAQGVAASKRDTTVQQYIARVSMPLAALNGPYTMSLFLGAFDEDAATWSSEPSFVGANTVLGMPNGDKDTVVNADIILTDALMAKHQSGELKNLHMDTVVKFVKKNLRWRLSQNNQKVPRSQVPGAGVVLTSTAVQPPTTPEEFPTFLETNAHGPINGTDSDAPSS